MKIRWRAWQIPLGLMLAATLSTSLQAAPPRCDATGTLETLQGGPAFPLVGMQGLLCDRHPPVDPNDAHADFARWLDRPFTSARDKAAPARFELVLNGRLPVRIDVWQTVNDEGTAGAALQGWLEHHYHEDLQPVDAIPWGRLCVGAAADLCVQTLQQLRQAHRGESGGLLPEIRLHAEDRLCQSSDHAARYKAGLGIRILAGLRKVVHEADRWLTAAHLAAPVAGWPADEAQPLLTAPPPAHNRDAIEVRIQGIELRPDGNHLTFTANGMPRSWRYPPAWMWAAGDIGTLRQSCDWARDTWLGRRNRTTTAEIPLQTDPENPAHRLVHWLLPGATRAAGPVWHFSREDWQRLERWHMLVAWHMRTHGRVPDEPAEPFATRTAWPSWVAPLGPELALALVQRDWHWNPEPLWHELEQGFRRMLRANRRPGAQLLHAAWWSSVGLAVCSLAPFTALPPVPWEQESRPGWAARCDEPWREVLADLARLDREERSTLFRQILRAEGFLLLLHGPAQRRRWIRLALPLDVAAEAAAGVATHALLPPAGGFALPGDTAGRNAEPLLGTVLPVASQNGHWLFEAARQLGIQATARIDATLDLSGDAGVPWTFALQRWATASETRSAPTWPEAIRVGNRAWSRWAPPTPPRLPVVPRQAEPWMPPPGSTGETAASPPGGLYENPETGSWLLAAQLAEAGAWILLGICRDCEEL